MKFAAIIEYIQDKEKTEAIRPAHRQYLTDLLRRGQLAATGPFTDGSGALIIYEAPSAENGFFGSHGAAIEAKWPIASICVPCCCGSAPASNASLLKACAEKGTPAVGFGLLGDGFANGDFGIVFERTNDAS